MKAKEKKENSEHPRPGWAARLHACASPAEVLDVARAYVARISYYETLCLPEQCRPRRLLAPKDISEFWLDLSRHAHGDSEAAARAVQRLTQFFAAADSRLIQLSVADSSAAKPGGKRRRDRQPGPAHDAE